MPKRHQNCYADAGLIMKHQLQNSNSVSSQGEYKRAGSKIEIFPKIDDHKQILPVIARLAAITIFP